MTDDTPIKDLGRQWYGRLAGEGSCWGSPERRKGPGQSCGFGYSSAELASLVYVRAHKAGSHTAFESHPRADTSSLLSLRDRALIAVGVARAAHSEAELRSSIEEARGLGWSEEAIQGAIRLSDRTTEMANRVFRRGTPE